MSGHQFPPGYYGGAGFSHGGGGGVVGSGSRNATTTSAHNAYATTRASASRNPSASTAVISNFGNGNVGNGIAVAHVQTPPRRDQVRRFEVPPRGRSKSLSAIEFRRNPALEAGRHQQDARPTADSGGGGGDGGARQGGSASGGGGGGGSSRPANNTGKSAAVGPPSSRIPQLHQHQQHQQQQQQHQHQHQQQQRQHQQQQHQQQHQQQQQQQQQQHQQQQQQHQHQQHPHQHQHQQHRPPYKQHRRRYTADPSAPRTPYDDGHLRIPPRLKPPPVMSYTAVAPMPSYFGAPPELYPMREHSAMDFAVRIPERSPARNSILVTRGSVSRTPYPGLQAPSADPTKTVDALPAVLNRPRKLSSGSSAGSTSTRDSFESRMSYESRVRSSSWGSRTSFESAESAVGPGAAVMGMGKGVTNGNSSGGGGSAWHSDYFPGFYQRPMPVARPRMMRVRKAPGEMFATLPGEVLELILDELKKLHLGKGSDSCATCWMRDLCNVSLSARKWYKFARTALYEDIQLVGPDSAVHKKRYKLAYGSRLVLLRRTLRSNPQIGAIVHKLKVPATPQGSSLEEYQNLVASVIMACPNLERLTGPPSHYNHSFNRIFHALSTRGRLKEMSWMLEPPPFQRQHKIRSSSSSGNLAAAAAAAMRKPGSSGGSGGNSNRSRPEPVTVIAPTVPRELTPQQTAAFLDNHINWNYLTTLSIHCMPGATISPATLVTTVVSCLPSLQNLNLSRLPASAFNDNNLLSLPPLKKLSLSHLPGVSSAGLSALATGASSHSLKLLTLRHANLDSLPALVRIFSNLVQLECFSLVQAAAPAMSSEEASGWLMMPYLASASLRRLHWDITTPTATTTANSRPTAAAVPPPFSSLSDSILARSIGAGGFPSLRTLRAPNDPEGMFQALCRPQERADGVTDRFRSGFGHGLGAGSVSSIGGRPHTPASPTKLPSKSPTSPSFPPEALCGGPGVGGSVCAVAAPEATDLHQARLAAQARLEAARRLPRYFVNIIDEDGLVAEKYGIAGFMGSIESRISYHLQPDPGATDERGGLVDLADLQGDGGEIISVKGACCGRWNMAGGVVDKKDKDRWWHTERGRWKAIEMP